MGTLFCIIAGLGIGGGGRKDWRYAQDERASVSSKKYLSYNPCHICHLANTAPNHSHPRLGKSSWIKSASLINCCRGADLLGEGMEVENRKRD